MDNAASAVVGEPGPEPAPATAGGVVDADALPLREDDAAWLDGAAWEAM